MTPDAHHLKLKKEEKEEKAAKLMNPKIRARTNWASTVRAMEHNWCRDGTWQITKKIDGTALYCASWCTQDCEEIEEEDVLSE